MYYTRLLYFLIFSFLISCSSDSHKSDSEEQEEIKRIDLSQYHTKLDTVYIEPEMGGIYAYSQVEFNNIIDLHPEFFADYPFNPDHAYYRFADNKEFGSEAGRDEYYVLYTYFLKQKNGEKEFEEQRQRLIKIYFYINTFFKNIDYYGGTYFLHQVSRISAYVEYSVWELSQASKYHELKIYDVAKQKQLYIQSLQQIIRDNPTINEELSEEERKVRIKALYEIVQELESLIIDPFYLKKAQKIHYQHYE